MAPILRDIAPVENIDKELGLLLSMFEDGTNEWRREMIELDLPQEAMTWKPTEDFQSIGNILTHMMASEMRWIHELATLGEIAEDFNQIGDRWQEAAESFKLGWDAQDPSPILQETSSMMLEIADLEERAWSVLIKTFDSEGETYDRKDRFQKETQRPL